MDKLQNLLLHDLPITDAGLKPLAGLKNRKGLNLNRTRVTDSGAQLLSTDVPWFEIMRMGETKVTVGGVQHLAAMKKLQTVEFYGTSVTAAAIQKLKAERPGIYVTYARGREGR